MRYDQTGIAAIYHENRRLSDETLRLWLDQIADSLPAPKVQMVIDVGCGTGRFAEALATRFGVQVVGVDPSREMLERAQLSTVDANVSYRQGSAENLPVADECGDLLFLSMVYHHIDDLDRALDEMHRVLRQNGFICVRNYTVDQLEQIPYLEFFPAARAVSRQMLPTRQALVRDLSLGGYELVSHDVVRQKSADTPALYLQKVGQRVYSDLVLISDTDFQSGLERMASACDLDDQSPVYESVDFFVFRSNVTRTAR